ncbi:hypothetical protein [uncultured Tenacibaculum sp.]|uniref:hypothetical protein n=1 Tax=uncultured Tenacibaculum sp. TaxID=174713 RepID=UPI0026233F0C|nr:hypothetical protein [uncultured Tenacibaculum sp.]
MDAIFLRELFEELNKESIRYCVLRGYEKLPKKVVNDVDFGIASSDKKFFFSILNKLAFKHCYDVKIELIRLDVIKMQFYNEFDEVLKIDIWWSFNYVGLEYLNIDELLSSKMLYNGLIYVPSEEYEFALSFLKELLHNNWIRKDKIKTLKSKMKENSYKPFEGSFNKAIVKSFYLAVNNSELKLSKLSAKAKVSLIFNNFKNKSLYHVFNKIFIFFKIRYNYKDEYGFLLKQFSLDFKN